MDNNNLVPGEEYIITIKNTDPIIRYIKKYKDTITNLNGKLVHRFYTNDDQKLITFTVESIDTKKIDNTTSSVLGKRQTQIDDNNVQNNKIAKSEMTFTEEEIRKDREYWEAVDGGAKHKGNKRKKTNKRKKSKTSRRKSRKYNK